MRSSPEAENEYVGELGMVHWTEWIQHWSGSWKAPSMQLKQHVGGKSAPSMECGCLSHLQLPSAGLRCAVGGEEAL